MRFSDANRLVFDSLPHHPSSQSAGGRSLRLQHHAGLPGGGIPQAHQLLGSRHGYNDQVVYMLCGGRRRLITLSSATMSSRTCVLAEWLTCYSLSLPANCCTSFPPLHGRERARREQLQPLSQIGLKMYCKSESEERERERSKNKLFSPLLEDDQSFRPDSRLATFPLRRTRLHFCFRFWGLIMSSTTCSLLLSFQSWRYREERTIKSQGSKRSICLVITHGPHTFFLIQKGINFFFLSLSFAQIFLFESDPRSNTTWYV